MADSAAPPRSLMGLLLSLQEPGKRLIDAGELYQFLNALYGVTTVNSPAATASIPLTTGIGVVIDAPAGVTLPPPTLPGQIVTVVNTGTAAVDVTGTGSPVSLAAAASAQYLCTAIGTWTALA